MTLTSDRLPAVSIGLPVYNGERYLDETIRSILGQSFRDIELIVSDNASTDATAEICARHAAADPRLRYHRQPRNLGAGRNYDTCHELARGHYFKWAAHDDLLAPDYIARAVAALERNPRAIFCTVGIVEIDEAGRPLRVYHNRFPGVDSDDPARRFGALIHTRHQVEDFFGLYRREALVGSSMHGNYNGSDRVLMAEMALRGPWVQLTDPLFLHREHPHRYTRALLLKDPRAAQRFQDTSQGAERRSPYFHWTVYRHLWRVMRANVRDPATLRDCEAELLRWWLTDGHAADVLRDLLRVNTPRLFAAIRGAKRALFGVSPGTQQPGALPPVG
jgi:glycosyltransferase involved in cell wall biosynthesis